MKDDTVIVAKLDELAELTAQRDEVRLEYEEQREAIVRPLLETVQGQLADLQSGYMETAAELDFKIATLTEAVKQEVLAHGETVKGSRLQACYGKARVKWDPQALDGYALGHPELFAFRTEGEPSVSFRVVK